MALDEKALKTYSAEQHKHNKHFAIAEVTLGLFPLGAFLFGITVLRQSQESFAPPSEVFRGVLVGVGLLYALFLLYIFYDAHTRVTLK